MEAEEDVYGELEVKSHRVIGRDASREVERRPEAAREPREYIRFTSHKRIELDDVGKVARRSPENEQCKLVTESHSTLKSLYALDIFSAFTWAVAKSPGVSIEQDVEILPCKASSEDAWRFFTLRSSRLSNMALDIESTGLGSLEEVYFSIIPPLSAKQKLPQVQAIIELVREHTKQYEEQQQWHDATMKYRWLGQLAKTFPVTSADKDAKGRGGETPLHTAVEKGRQPIVRVLIANGAKMESENDENMTPLQKAVQRGKRKIAEQLIEAGANRQVRDKTGGTLLHMADCSDQMAKLLIQHGADMDARDNKGQTPLHIAAIAGRQATIKLLLASGADKEARDNDGRTPLDRARRDGTAMLLEAAIQIDKKRSL
ncbi:hypothetical protein V2A60_000845 [Cordyceps javanica]